jgi:hypothetical protein
VRSSAPNVSAPVLEPIVLLMIKNLLLIPSNKQTNNVYLLYSFAYMTMTSSSGWYNASLLHQYKSWLPLLILKEKRYNKFRICYYKKHLKHLCCKSNYHMITTTTAHVKIFSRQRVAQNDDVTLNCVVKKCQIHQWQGTINWKQQKNTTLSLPW